MKSLQNRGRRGLVALVVALAFTALASRLAAAGPSPQQTQPQTQLQRDADGIRALGVIGVQAEVRDRAGSRIVTSGRADRLTGAPVPVQGRFRIASVRKAMVAVVALQLVGEGRLGLDDPVGTWLPDTVPGEEGRRITVRHLLQNTSGLHDDQPGYETPQGYLEQRYDVHTRDELIARALRHRPDFAPGTGWAYSNTGFLVLGAVVEKAGKRPLERLTRERIAQPLGLKTLSWPGISPLLPAPHARAHQVFGNGAVVDVTEQVPSDPDAVVGSTRDLTIFFQAVLDGRLLPRPQHEAMQRTVPVTPEIDAFMPGARYGLGLISRPLACGGVYWGHDGGDAGFITVTGVTPDGRRSAVVSMNTALGGTPTDPVRQQRAADTLIAHALCGRT
ncbi:serine hydrolase domain-containing protein [Kineosporia sp. NBRC 101731]|uniref:serine hydrolase domain-containing protein n=1 Tax=Kineosporia sp. NBRC 101731 TaxID=3032199 RepID=UPI00255765E3|nr:serine hydrolase domain-containing protein [Kineosporia sp. NBRC 101731]